MGGLSCRFPGILWNDWPNYATNLDGFFTSCSVGSSCLCCKSMKLPKTLKIRRTPPWDMDPVLNNGHFLHVSARIPQNFHIWAAHWYILTRRFNQLGHAKLSVSVAPSRCEKWWMGFKDDQPPKIGSSYWRFPRSWGYPEIIHWFIDS